MDNLKENRSEKMGLNIGSIWNVTIIQFFQKFVHRRIHLWGSLQKVTTVSIPVFVNASPYCPWNAVVQQPQNCHLQLILQLS